MKLCCKGNNSKVCVVTFCWFNLYHYSENAEPLWHDINICMLWGGGGGGGAARWWGPSSSSINSRYLLLFVFTVFRAPWEQFLPWWNWTAFPVEFITGEGHCPPPCSQARRDWENPEGWVSVVVVEEERGHKHSANDHKHTNNSAGINTTAQMKKSTSSLEEHEFSKDKMACLLFLSPYDVLVLCSLCLLRLSKLWWYSDEGHGQTYTHQVYQEHVFHT